MAHSRFQIAFALPTFRRVYARLSLPLAPQAGTVHGHGIQGLGSVVWFLSFAVGLLGRRLCCPSTKQKRARETRARARARGDHQVTILRGLAEGVHPRPLFLVLLGQIRDHRTIIRPPKLATDLWLSSFTERQAKDFSP